jgi:hypothetical protein
MPEFTHTLTTSKPLTSAQLETLHAFAERVLDPAAPVQVLGDGWVNQDRDSSFCPSFSHYRRTPAPADPILRPWTFTEAVGKLVTGKQGRSKSVWMINGADEINAYIGGSHVTFQELLDRYERLDGNPCGVAI